MEILAAGQIGAGVGVIVTTLLECVMVIGALLACMMGVGALLDCMIVVGALLAFVMVAGALLALVIVMGSLLGRERNSVSEDKDGWKVGHKTWAYLDEVDL